MKPIVSTAVWKRRRLRSQIRSGIAGRSGAKSAGNPRVIKDLLGDHALEKCVDAEVIQSIDTQQGVRYFAISPFVLLIILAFSIYRYVGLGLGDREAYIVVGAGTAIFIVLAAFVRKANKV